MILSHKYKFIFIKTEKTAGTSLEIALSEFCGPDDIITRITIEDELKRKELGYRTAQNYRIPFSKYVQLDWGRLFLKQRTAKFYNHMSATEIKRLVSEEVWNTYYKFSFDRNPWDKMISWYYWKNRNSDFVSIDDFIEKGMGGVKGYDLYTIGGVKAVDSVFKYEDIPRALRVITDKLNLPKPLQMPDYIAKGGARKEKKHYSEFLSSEAVEYVNIMAAREIRLLDYHFNNMFNSQ